MPDFTHFDDEGRPLLVDVGEKTVTRRTARAEGWIDLPQAVFAAVVGGGVKKGDPFSIAELAGITGSKMTAQIVPLCHNIRIDNVAVKCRLDCEKKAVLITCEASAREVTGVEMEALTGVATAALCFYDMCKALDKGMVIRDIRLLSKSGGKSGDWPAEREIKE